MATTALAPAPRNEFSLFGENALLKEAMAEVGESITPADLVRVKIPSGGGKKWTIETAAGEKTVDAIEGILCYVQKRGVLWAEDEPKEGALPVLVTYDLKTAEQAGPIPKEMEAELARCKIGEGLYDWEKLSYNEFGSGKGGHGKKCKEQRLLFILQKGSIYPLVVTAPPGSLKNVRKFLIQVPEEAKAPYYHCTVKLALEQDTSAGGQKYSKIVPTLTGILPAADGEKVKATYHAVLGRVAKQLSDEHDAE